METQAIETTTNSLIPGAEASTSATIRESISSVLSVEDESASAKINGNTRINEQEMYAAITHYLLAEKNPELAERFLNDLPATLQAFRESGVGTDFFKSTDRIMRAMLRERKITHAEYKELRNEAYGKAQFDSDRSWLDQKKVPELKDGDTALRSVDTALKMYEKNPAANETEIGQFKARVAELSRKKWKSSGLSSAQKAAEPAASPGGAENSALSPINGFLWKPVSDSDGKLVILLPSSLTGQAEKVSIFSANGETLIASGRYAGIGNGMRQHYRFDKPGNAFPDGAIVEVQLRDGGKMQIKIGDTSARIG